jgi:hypothetical protein
MKSLLNRLTLLSSMLVIGCSRTVTPPRPVMADASITDRGPGPDDGPADVAVPDVADDVPTVADASSYCWISGPHDVPPEAGPFWVCPSGYRCGRPRPGQGWSCCAVNSPSCRVE